MLREMKFLEQNSMSGIGHNNDMSETLMKLYGYYIILHLLAMNLLSIPLVSFRNVIEISQVFV